MQLEKTKQKYENKVIETAKGLPLKISINQVFEGGSQRWEYFEIEAKDTNNHDAVGYLKLAVLSKDNYSKYFGNILKFSDAQKGMPFNVAPKPEISGRKSIFSGSELVNPSTLSGKKSIIEKSRWNGKSIVGSLITAKDVEKEFEKVLDYLDFKFGKSYKEFTEYHLEKPEVHYVNVEKDFTRKGVASVLYDVAVDLVENNGYKLYQSSTQTPEAEKFWASRHNVVKGESEERYKMTSESEKINKRLKNKPKP